MIMIITGVARTGGNVASLNRLARCSGVTVRLKAPRAPTGIDNICLCSIRCCGLLEQEARGDHRFEPALRKLMHSAQQGQPSRKLQSLHRPIGAHGLVIYSNGNGREVFVAMLRQELEPMLMASTRHLCLRLDLRRR